MSYFDTIKHTNAVVIEKTFWVKGDKWPQQIGSMTDWEDDALYSTMQLYKTIVQPDDVIQAQTALQTWVDTALMWNIPVNRPS